MLNDIPDKVKLEKSFSKNRLLFDEAWKNSQKSAVVGGGDGESGSGNGAGDCKQLEDAGLRLEPGVATS